MSTPSTTDRMTRLLSLVPYLTARPDGVPLAEVARDFGVPERQLQRDLELLWMCGLPGYGPGDLIDLAFEGDRVRVTFDAGMVRPLRLTTDEAVALIVALRALLELPGLAEQEAVSRALAKVAAAAGHAAEVTPVALSVDTREHALAVVREGLERGRALHLHYYVPTRDERTERTVDPMRLLYVDGRWYLEAWCRRAEGMRLFRLDRVDDVEVLDEPAAPPPQAHERDVENGVYQPEPGWPAPPAGSPTTTRSSRSRPPTTRPAASPSPSAPPTSPGPGGWSPPWAGPPSSTSPPSSPRRWPPTPAPRSPGTGSSRPAPPARVGAVVLLVVWIALVVVAAVVLGGLLLSLRGAQQRLHREVAGLQQDLAPTLAAVADTRARAAGRGTGQQEPAA
jgi:proteasome accessory factor C